MWAIGIKDGQIVKGGKDLLLDGTFDEFVITEEIYARQIEKLDYKNGELHVIEGMTIEPLEVLNEQLEEPIQVEEVNIVTPINIQPLT